MTPAQAFGETLKRVRAYKSLSVEELAARAGVPVSRVMRFESAMTEPTLSELFLLGHALKARPCSIVEGVEFLVSGLLVRQSRQNGEDREPRSSPPSTS